jgi:protein-L-isoaspartate(D-aspartate) O-methyltransferase
MDKIDTLIRQIEADARATAHYTGRTRLSPTVLRAIRKVRRDRFIPAWERADAFLNTPLPIGHGQTISQPFIVALMTDMLDLERGHSVLEIGTGSGYQAAILAQLCDHVASIEAVAPLAERAAETLRREGYESIALRIGDGRLGWPEKAPFDRIIVTAAARSVPPALLVQLQVRGRMIIPIGDPYGEQELRLLCKDQDGTVTDRSVLPVGFVPLTGGNGV